MIFLGGFIIFLCISSFLAKWAVYPAETAWIQQKQFVADASHELRTPLTIILTNTELMCSPECSEEEKDCLAQNILTVSQQMRGLIEKLLDLAQADRGAQKKKLNRINSQSGPADRPDRSEKYFQTVLPVRYHPPQGWKLWTRSGNRTGDRGMA